MERTLFKEETEIGNPKVAMRAEIEAKLRAKYEQKLREMEREYQAKLALERHNHRVQVRMAMQQSCDGALMAADDVFGCTEDQAAQFVSAHMEYVNKMSHMAVVEDKDDPDMWWTKDTIDRRLKRIAGKHFQCWDERYAQEEE